MKRLIAFPFIFAVFFGPISTLPGHETGSVEAAAVVTIDASLGFEAIAPQEAAEEESEDTPWAIVLPLAFAVPLAVLLIPAFLRKRTPGSH